MSEGVKSKPNITYVVSEGVRVKQLCIGGNSQIGINRETALVSGKKQVHACVYLKCS